MNVISKTGHIRSDFHAGKKRFAFVATKKEFDKPETTQVDSILKGVIKYCKYKFSILSCINVNMI